MRGMTLSAPLITSQSAGPSSMSTSEKNVTLCSVYVILYFHFRVTEDVPECKTVEEKKCTDDAQGTCQTFERQVRSSVLDKITIFPYRG